MGNPPKPSRLQTARPPTLADTWRKLQMGVKPKGPPPFIAKVKMIQTADQFKYIKTCKGPHCKEQTREGYCCFDCEDWDWLLKEKLNCQE